ncbi:MAG TPA: hypothetical protein DC038_07405 [Clostridiales bacterium]|nr:hypothetical protein [Clostridiales bacterium]
MNYEITGNLITEPASVKNCFTPFLLLILSALFIPAAYIFVAAVFIVGLFRKNSRIREMGRLDILVYAYVATGLISSDYRLISAVYAAIMLLCLYAFHIFSSLNSSQLGKLRSLLLIVSLAVFIIGILQYFSPGFSIPSKWVDSGEYSINRRIYSTFYNPNVFGFYISFIILIACENLDLRKVNLESAVFAIGTTCLILTFSRTSWVSLLAGLSVAALRDKKYIKYILILAIAIFGTDLLMGIGRANPARAMEDSSFLYRLDVWKACIEIIKDNFVSGIGFGTLFMHISEYSSSVSTKIEHCHNIYLQILTETGFLGFSIFSMVAAGIFKKLRNITAFAVLAMTMVSGLVDSIPLTPQIMIMLSMYAGALNEKKSFPD